MKVALVLLSACLLHTASGQTYQSDLDLEERWEDVDVRDGIDSGYAVNRRQLAEGPTVYNNLVVCGNNSLSLTVTISGTASNTNCTVSESLSDDGATLCSAVGQVFDEDCDIFLGGLYINIAYSNPAGTRNPDVQSSLATLGLGNLSQIGLLHVSVGGVNKNALESLNFLPKLQGIIGAPSPNPGNAFAGSALYVAGNSVSSISSFPALARLTDIVGTTILQNLALTNLTGLGRLQIVEGDLVVQNNPVLASLQGAAQSLTDVYGQLYVANNPALRNLAGVNVSGGGPGTLRNVGGRITIGNNPNMTSLAGLENLRSIGGSLTVTQNQMLQNISALAGFANCASNSTNQTTPTPIFVQVMASASSIAQDSSISQVMAVVQRGAPPISCIMNNFVAICSYIKSGGCPNPDGTSALDALRN